MLKNLDVRLESWVYFFRSIVERASFRAYWSQRVRLLIIQSSFTKSSAKKQERWISDFIWTSFWKIQVVSLCDVDLKCFFSLLVVGICPTVDISNPRWLNVLSSGRRKLFLYYEIFSLIECKTIPVVPFVKGLYLGSFLSECVRSVLHWTQRQNQLCRCFGKYRWSLIPKQNIKNLIGLTNKYHLHISNWRTPPSNNDSVKCQRLLVQNFHFAFWELVNRDAN